MPDIVSQNKLMLLHPKVRDKAIAAYNEAVRITPVGIHPFITQTLRTFAESDDLYAQGRTAPGNIVTNAKAGQSYHNYGLALDFVIQVNGLPNWNVDANWMLVVNTFKNAGFFWGGDFTNLKDNPHLEMRFSYNWRQLLQMYNDKDFIAGTTYVNI